MVEKKLLDSEWEWIFRTCTNAFNIYVTMMHFIFYDNILNLRPENSGKSIETIPYRGSIIIRSNANTIYKISEISLLSYTLFMTALDLFAYCIYQ